jgi:hypothetical protein
MPTFYLDYENGNDLHSGTSFSLLASAADGATTAGSSSAFGTFSSASANFPNDGTLAATKNLAWYSNCLYGNSVASASFIEKNSITGPSGIDATVYKLWEDSQTTTHYWQSTTWHTPLSATTQYTISLYVKAAERTKVILRLDNDAKAARFNLSSGTVEATGASATSSISNIGDGWYRISITALTNGAADNIQIILIPNDNTGLTFVSYNGDNNDGFYICGLQIEQAASATSYEKPPEQYISMALPSGQVAMYHIVRWLSATSLRINITPNNGQVVSTYTGRTYYIGGRWKTFSTTGASATRLASDDTVRIMSSPDPTSIGSGTWVGSKMQGASNVNSSTNASPIVVTCASTMAALGISNGDTVVVTGHTTNTNANGTWEVTNVSGSTCSLVGSTGNGVGGTSGFLRKVSNQRVILASSPIVNIASHGNRGNGRTAWIAQTANITTSLVTTDALGGIKEGDCSDSIAVGANFTTGLAAYKSTGTLNLSGYQQISFWIKQTAGSIGASGALSLVLCSDTLGATAVNTFNIENLTALNRWIPITIDLATNLGASIQSIGFYVNTDNGAQTFLLSNIIACKASSSADSLNLCSLIGKNTSGETWCGIQSINGTRVMLDTGGQFGPVTIGLSSIQIPGYYGTSETITTYKRETIKVPLAATATALSSLLNFQRGGVAPQSYGVGNPIVYSFGWNRTNMSTRTGESWFDGRNGFGYGNYAYYLSGGNLTIDRMCFVRFYYGLFIPGCMYSVVTNYHGNNCDQYGLYAREHRNVTYDTIYCCYGSIGGVFAFAQAGQTIFRNMVICSNNGAGFTHYNSMSNALDNFTIKNNINGISIIQAHNLTANSGTISDSWQYGIDNNGLGYNNVFKNTTLSTNTTASTRSNVGGPSYFINSSLNDTTEVAIASPGYGNNSKVFSHNHDQTNNLHYIWCDYGLIYSTTSVRYTNNGIAWAMAPTHGSIRYIGFPLDLSVATVAVSANSQVTVKAWMRRTNIGLVMRLRVKGGQIAGVANDVTGYMTGASADTWEQVSISFTPTEAGVVEILAECWGGTTFTGYVDDLTIIQA